MVNTYLFRHFLRHFFRAGNEHGLHSPFIYELYTTCFRNRSQYYAFAKIEAQRNKLLSSNECITITDFGAGSQLNKSNTRPIKDIAKNSLTPQKQAEQLFRIINFLQPQHIVEFGTSLGITTAYLAAPNTHHQVHSMEGCPNTAAVAQKVFNTLQLKNIHLHVGEFSHSLQTLKSTLPSFDLVYFDGNHSYDATLSYFEECLDHITDEACFIFDDIYWSSGMTAAWKRIQEDERVTLSMDTFYFGICFFRKGQPKQHFNLR